MLKLPTFTVNSDCIACDTCSSVAAQFFSLNQSYDKAYLKSQPKTAADYALCDEALETCPVQAIGKTSL